MWQGMFKVVAATALFGVVHSALASTAAKQAVQTVLGSRNRNGLYRTFFIVQSAATSGLLAAYIRRQSGQELYHVRGPLALVMHAGQIVGLICTFSAARQVGLTRISGLESLVAWLGDGPVPAEPEAQGPALDAEGLSHAAGPFVWSRHPLNFFPLLVLLLRPKMTTNLLAFNAATTVYLLIGSLHEEARLRRAYGEWYAAYQLSGVPFYVPRPNREASQPLQIGQQADDLSESAEHQTYPVVK